MAGHLDFPRLPALATTGGGHPRLARLVRLVTGHLPGGQELPLCRLRYLGLADQWGFALYRASIDGYEDTLLPTGTPTGTPEQALDFACGLYLDDPSAWQNEPPKD